MATTAQGRAAAVYRPLVPAALHRRLQDKERARRVADLCLRPYAGAAEIFRAGLPEGLALDHHTCRRRAGARPGTRRSGIRKAEHRRAPPAG